MRREEIINKIKTLSLPKGSYVIIGSCPLAIAGIREAKDIDLMVSKEVHKKLRKSGWKELFKSKNDVPITYDCFEAHENCNFSSYKPSLDDLLKKATDVEGIPFASLEDIIKWKTVSGRPKDLADIKLINKHLKR